MNKNKTINIQYSDRFDYPEGTFELFEELKLEGIPYSRFLGALVSKFNTERQSGMSQYESYFTEWKVKYKKLENE